jgi:hypothetical protein
MVSVVATTASPQHQTTTVADNNTTTTKQEDISELVLGRVLEPDKINVVSSSSDLSQVSTALATNASPPVVAQPSTTITTTTVNNKNRPKPKPPVRRRGRPAKKNKTIKARKVAPPSKATTRRGGRAPLPVETVTTNSKGETVTKVRMLTGTLYMYRAGPEGRKLRAEFVRSK